MIDSLVSALRQARGNASAAARVLGITRNTFYTHVYRSGLSLTELRFRAAQQGYAAAPEPDARVSVSPVVADAVDTAALAMRALALQAEIEQRDHIIAVLTARLEDMGARYASA